MNFADATRVCFQKYVDFSGRATRSEFWFFTLFVQLLFVCSAVLDPYVVGAEPNEYLEIYGPVSLVTQIITLLPSLTVTARRLQDTGITGWWMLLAFTGVGLIPLLYWLCRPSGDDSNRFGDSFEVVYGEGVNSPAPALVRFLLLPLLIAAIALSASFWYFSNAVMEGGLMGVKVFSGGELSEEQLTSLRSVELITVTDRIHFFYSDELGVVNKSGQFLTQNRVVSFMTNEEGDLVSFEMPLEHIDRVEVVRPSDESTDGEYKILGNDDAKYEFITIFLPSYGGGERKFLSALGVEIK
jgi:uncharacterized membrane protein YhaH (DUF805 family)